MKERENRKKRLCLACGREISEEEYEIYDGLCEKCYEIEIDELDYEDAIVNSGFSVPFMAAVCV
ncbi:MAG: hypothetical protein QW821_00255 [Candidatus Bathyarchaeia archaeon]